MFFEKLLVEKLLIVREISQTENLSSHETFRISFVAFKI